MKNFSKVNIYVAGKGIVKTSINFDERIVSIGEKAEGEKISLPKGAIVLPGFIDQHIHGASGCDAMDGSIEGLSTIAKSLASEGTVAFLATTMTQSPENIKKALGTVKEYKDKVSTDGAEVLGVHLEGPFISEKHIGAQPLEYVAKPNVCKFKEYNQASGNNIKLVTLSPETDDNLELISYLKSQGIVASAGHTDAGYDVLDKAISCGLQNVTHLFNAQRGVHHREIGVAGTGLLRNELYTEVIADTIHLSVPAIKLAVKSKPSDKLVLITDAMRAKNLPDGLSELGGQKVIVKNGEARLENGALAGSVLKMIDSVKNMVTKVGVDLTTATDYATINPATNLGIDKDYGSISVGKYASFVVIDSEFNVIMTIRQGKIIYKAMAKSVTISDKDLSVEISTYGAEIQNAIYKGKNYIYNGSHPSWNDHAPVLFPFAGGLWNKELIYKGNKYPATLHGFGGLKTYEIVEEKKNSVTLLLKSDEQTYGIYPFKFEFYVTYTVKGNKISVCKKVVNVDNGDIYFATGSHEGIACDSDKSNLKAVFNKKEKFETLEIYPGTGYLNGEKTLLTDDQTTLKLCNDNFIDGNTLIFGSVNSNSITLYKDGEKYVKYDFEPENVLIWSEETAPFICFEFWTNLPDYYNQAVDFDKKSGVFKLAKGKSKKICHSIELF